MAPGHRRTPDLHAKDAARLCNPSEMMGPAGPQETGDGFELRVAATEVNGRRVNEAIERGQGGADTAVFMCECGHVGCNTMITMRLNDYEAVRTDFERFFVAPGHEIGDVDRVVERYPDYLVVIKTGAAREVARDDDPRAGMADEDKTT